MNDKTRVHGSRLVEGAVIVVSILLAFGVDAMWAQWQLRGEEREALVSLQAEFTANLTQVERIIAVYVEGRGHLETLVRLSPAEIRSLPQSTISAMMLATSNLWTFDPVLGTTDALVGAGKLGILRDPNLREALTTFSNQVADVAEDVGWMTPFALQMWQVEIRHGGPWTDPETEVGLLGPVPTPDFIEKVTAEELLGLRTDAEFMGLASRFYLNAGYYEESLEELRAQVVLIRGILNESN